MLNTNNAIPGRAIRSRAAFALIAATLLAGGCITEASAKSKHRQQAKHSHQAKSKWQDAKASIGPQTSGRSFAGKASFYGNESGNKTASGQRFNQNAMTAAHRTLPFGTKLRVTHRGQSVVVTINDRGPFIKGRVIDLSEEAAKRLGFLEKGVAKVRVDSR